MIIRVIWLPPEEGKDSITMYVIIMIIEKDVRYIFYDDFACQKCHKKYIQRYNKNYPLM